MDNAWRPRGLYSEIGLDCAVLRADGWYVGEPNARYENQRIFRCENISAVVGDTSIISIYLHPNPPAKKHVVLRRQAANDTAYVYQIDGLPVTIAFAKPFLEDLREIPDTLFACIRTFFRDRRRRPRPE